MKRSVIIFAVMLSLVSCGDSSVSLDSSNISTAPKADTTALNTTTFPKTAPQEYRSVTQIGDDRIVYYDIDELYEASDIIVIGEFIDDTFQEVSYQNNDEFSEPILIDAVSHNVISVKKEIKGSPAETLKISQSYGISNEGELVAFSGLSQVRKGESWLFFLNYDESNDTYWCEGDFTGRYPLPDETLRAKVDEYLSAVSEYDDLLSETNDGTDSFEFTPDQQKKADDYTSKINEIYESLSPDEMGVIDRENLNFKFALYSALISKYGADIEWR